MLNKGLAVRDPAGSSSLSRSVRPRAGGQVDRCLPAEEFLESRHLVEVRGAVFSRVRVCRTAIFPPRRDKPKGTVAPKLVKRVCQVISEVES